MKDAKKKFEIKQMPRKYWENQFKEMNKNGDDNLLIPDFFVDEDIIDWNISGVSGQTIEASTQAP